MTQTANKIAGLVARVQERFPRLVQRMVEGALAEKTCEGWDVQLPLCTTVVAVRPIQQWQTTLEKASKELPVPPIHGLLQSAALEADWQPYSFLCGVTPSSDVAAKTSLEQRSNTIVNVPGKLFCVVWPDVTEPVVSHVLEADTQIICRVGISG